MLNKRVFAVLYWYTYCMNNPLKYTDPSGCLTAASNFALDIDNYFAHVCDVTGDWHNTSTFGGPGEGRNGTGLNGVYYDFTTNTYRSTVTGQTVSWDIVNSIISQQTNAKESQLHILGPGKPSITVTTYPSANDASGRYEIVIRVWGNMYSDYNYIQSANIDDEIKSPDGDDNHGFYYSDLWQKVFSAPQYRQGANGYFEDRPNGFYFNAELTLFGKSRGKWNTIQSFSWGYSINNGVVSHYFNPFWSPSDNQQKLINSTLNYFNH